MPTLKLNLGCGLVYKKGYINVDAFDHTIADQVMSILDLDFNDNYFSQIECMQVLEHLGAAKSIYALAEIYRVLEPNGLFVLETPDIETAFHYFLKNNESKRKILMNWIFGLDIPGMSHKYGFPKVLLEQVLREVGFADIKIEQIRKDTLQPTLRAICTKTDSQIHQFFTHLRKDLNQRGIADMENQVDIIELEELLQKILRLLLSGKTPVDREQIKQVLGFAFLSCPKVGLVLLEMMKKHNLVNSTDIYSFTKILTEFATFDLTMVTLHTFLEMPIIPGSQSNTFDLVKAMMMKSIGKVLSGDMEVLEQLRNTAESMSIDISLDFFSKTMLENVSNKQLALGSKAFSLGEYDDAIVHYKNSVKSNRDTLLGFWNLARLHSLRNDEKEALKFYQALESLISNQHPKLQRALQEKFNREIKLLKENRSESVAEPLISLY
ncbi:MAG: methyltransferase domain-containing protein [Candidatus Thorarchaeota archaeon]